MPDVPHPPADHGGPAPALPPAGAHAEPPPAGLRVVVVGCTGNVGTALLRRLRDDEAVASVVGVARRVPRREVPAPYDVVERWVACDVGAPDAVARLTDAFRGADAVVHLAWAIQPSRDRERLRSTNVEGTRAVLGAAALADVPHVVAASSVGAYAAVDDDEPRGEQWAATGIPSSSYSSDKAAQERLLDHAEAAGRAVARLRPALVFQRGAGAEVGRLFLGHLVPKALLRGPLPVLPWPDGLRLQSVHADDLAEAFRQVVVRRATGAFNIAGDGVLRAHDVAPLVRASTVVNVPVGAVRAGLSLAWRARLAAVGPGWLDMAAGAPLLDTSRAREQLGWAPRHSARAALAELLDGLTAGAGTASRPLHPRRRLAGSAPRVG